MNLRQTLIAAAALVFAAAGQAHECSGGADGGMDATGNQCNDVPTLVAAAPVAAAATTAQPAARPAAAKARPARATGRAASASRHVARVTAAEGR